MVDKPNDARGSQIERRTERGVPPTIVMQAFNGLDPALLQLMQRVGVGIVVVDALVLSFARFFVEFGTGDYIAVGVAAMFGFFFISPTFTAHLANIIPAAISALPVSKLRELLRPSRRENEGEG